MSHNFHAQSGLYQTEFTTLQGVSEALIELEVLYKNYVDAASSLLAGCASFHFEDDAVNTAITEMHNVFNTFKDTIQSKLQDTHSVVLIAQNNSHTRIPSAPVRAPTLRYTMERGLQPLLSQADAASSTISNVTTPTTAPLVANPPSKTGVLSTAWQDPRHSQPDPDLNKTLYSIRQDRKIIDSTRINVAELSRPDQLFLMRRSIRKKLPDLAAGSLTEAFLCGRESINNFIARTGLTDLDLGQLDELERRSRSSCILAQIMTIELQTLLRTSTTKWLRAPSTTFTYDQVELALLDLERDAVCERLRHNLHVTIRGVWTEHFKRLHDRCKHLIEQQFTIMHG